MTASTGDNGYQGGSLPGVLVLRHGGRRHLADRGVEHPRLERDRVERRRLGLLDVNTALAAAASFGTGCAKRAMADVSAAADPNNGGLAVYYPTSATASTWAQFGGTSESAPIIAVGLRAVRQHRRLRQRAPLQPHRRTCST